MRVTKVTEGKSPVQAHSWSVADGGPKHTPFLSFVLGSGVFSSHHFGRYPEKAERDMGVCWRGLGEMRNNKSREEQRF